MNATTCPSHAELSAFVVGNLSRPHFAHVAEHVQHCSQCEMALRSFDPQPDPLLDQLRRTSGFEEGTVDYVPPELLYAVCSVRSKPGAPHWTDADRRRLGKFELLEELGMGSFGHVFRARDTELDRTVAIKVL